MIPQGTTHFAVFYGDVSFYRLTHGIYINRVIDHPQEQFQKTYIWHVFEKGQWVIPGEGWSDRMLQSIDRYTSPDLQP